MVRRHRVRWVIGSLVLVLAAAAGAVAFAYPSLASTTCPGCYGLARLDDGVYLERGSTPAQEEQLRSLVADANRRVTDFYGDRQSSPRVVACVTSGCYDRIGGGGERGVAVLHRAIMLSPRGLDAVIAAHEMSHVELHRRLDGGVPQWFDEGLAVVVSDDPRYLGEHCRVPFEGPLPETLPAWLTAATADEQVYSRAACRVSRWLEANGGPPALFALIDRLNDGEAFPEVR